MAILAAVLALAAVTVGGTQAQYSETKSNSANLSTNSTFVPINTAVPTITTTLAAGVTSLTGASGTWRSNYSVSYQYKWHVCIVPPVCVDSSYSASPTVNLGITGLNVGALATGSTVKLTVQATNTIGSDTADSLTGTV
jgi:hypothetical protein